MNGRPSVADYLGRYAGFLAGYYRDRRQVLLSVREYVFTFFTDFKKRDFFTFFWK